MGTISKKQIIILLAIFITSLIFSFQDFFRYSRYDYDNSWEVIFLYGWGNYTFEDVSLSLLIISAIIFPLFRLIFFIVKIWRSFPTIEDAFYYYQEVNRVKKASKKTKEKQRLEKVKEEFKQKLAKLEEEKKKYL